MAGSQFHDATGRTVSSSVGGVSSGKTERRSGRGNRAFQRRIVRGPSRKRNCTEGDRIRRLNGGGIGTRVEVSRRQRIVAWKKSKR